MQIPAGLQIYAIVSIVGCSNPTIGEAMTQIQPDWVATNSKRTIIFTPKIKQVSSRPSNFQNRV